MKITIESETEAEAGQFPKTVVLEHIFEYGLAGRRSTELAVVPFSHLHIADRFELMPALWGLIERLRDWRPPGPKVAVTPPREAEPKIRVGK